MKIFNALQVVAAFVAWPFLISWLTSAQFAGHQVAFFAACALYVVGFFGMTYAVVCSMD